MAVHFGSQPNTSTYTCRPFDYGADEVCTEIVPSGQTQAYVSVRGYGLGTYTLVITYE